MSLGFLVSAAANPTSSVPVKAKVAARIVDANPWNPFLNAPGSLQVSVPKLCPFGAPPALITIPTMIKTQMAVTLISENTTSVVAKVRTPPTKLVRATMMRKMVIKTAGGIRCCVSQ